MISTVINEEGFPIEVAPGRGDLRRSSFPWNVNLPRAVPLVDRHLSFAAIFATQPMVALVVLWFLRQQRRVPLKVYRRTGDDSRQRLRAGDHPLATAISEPWSRGSENQLSAFLLGNFLVHGNALCEVESGALGALRFTHTDWRYAFPVMSRRDTIEGWQLDMDSPETERTRSADNVLHVRDWSPLSPLGISPLEQLGVTIAIEDAAQRHQRAMLANGVRTAAAVQMSDDRFLGLDPEERKELMDNLREDIEDIAAGPENSGRPWLLPPGLEVTKMGQTAAEAELLNQRVVDRTEALGLYGLPPAAAAVIERGTELPEQRQAAYSDGLAPALIVVEDAINSQVARSLLGEPDIFVEYDMTGVLRGDRQKEVEAIHDAVETAVMTPEEGRRVLNLPTDGLPDAMRKFYLPFNNLWPIDQEPPKAGQRDLEQAAN